MSDHELPFFTTEEIRARLAALKDATLSYKLQDCILRIEEGPQFTLPDDQAIQDHHYVLGFVVYKTLLRDLGLWPPVTSMFSLKPDKIDGTKPPIYKTEVYPEHGDSKTMIRLIQARAEELVQMEGDDFAAFVERVEQRYRRHRSYRREDGTQVPKESIQDVVALDRLEQCAARTKK